MGVSLKRLVLVASAAFLAVVSLSAQKKNEQKEDDLIRLLSGKSVQIVTDAEEHSYRKAIEATFLHNGAYLICDSAIWDVQKNIVNAFGHVQLIQDNTVLTSDRLDYFIDNDLAQFRGSVVQLTDKDNNILRTKVLDYNTRDSIAIFHNGAAMRSKDGQVIESMDGTYESKKSLFTFQDNVNMYTDSVFVKTNLLDYHSDTDQAVFRTYIDFWKDGDMLSASSGWYDRPVEKFFFTGHVHGTSQKQETWCDSLYFYRATNNIELLGHAQVQDTTRNTIALADYIWYEDSLSRVTLRKNAAVAIATEENGKTDTVYFGAHEFVYTTVKMCDIPESEIKTAKSRLDDIESDAVTQYRKKAAQAAKEAAEQAIANDPKRKAEKEAKEKAAKAAEQAAKSASQIAEAPEEPAPSDSLLSASDSLIVALDSLGVSPADSLVAPLDSLVAPLDSLVAPVDTLAAPLDTLAAPVDTIPVLDTTKVGFLVAKTGVKIYRHDMQVLCDSLRYTDLDSIARFYIDPIVWNEENRQYTADSLYTLIRNSRMDKASLLSNAFIATRESDDLYDQIKGAEVLAYFDSTSALKRFDALGGSTSMFFLRENEEIATVNKVECKMMSATFLDGDIDRVYYFDSPKNDAYPVVQLPKNDKYLKGFNWQPEKRPMGKRDITELTVIPSERSAYARRPKAQFKQTDLYFPGYMKEVYDGLERAKVMKREKRSAKPEEEITAPADTLAAPLDSLAAPIDSLSAPVDSLAAPLDSTTVAVDSLKANKPKEKQSETVKEPERQMTAAEKRQAAKEKREAKKAARIAAREAKWAEMDARDAAKEEAARQKEIQKKRERTRRALIAQQKEEMRDKATLEKYIRKYREEKARKAAKRFNKK